MIVNVMEQHVKNAYERLKSSVKDYEETPRHRDDVVVFALNRLPPKYVVSNEGKAVTEASLDSPQHRTAIDVQVFEALRQIARVPRNDRPPTGS
ncbi:MAG: late competence development ComFB family protein [Gemmatimonadota bacterium]